jgi:hypothetical protein
MNGTEHEQMSHDVAERADNDYTQARKRVEAKRNFASNLVAYVVVNAFFVGIWAFTGGGYFWPAWIIGGWGIGLVLHAWDAFFRRPITEADVRAEMQRHRR